jgi:hypothetical protein
MLVVKEVQRSTGYSAAIMYGQVKQLRNSWGLTVPQLFHFGGR